MGAIFDIRSTFGKLRLFSVSFEKKFPPAILAPLNPVSAKLPQLRPPQ